MNKLSLLGLLLVISVEISAAPTANKLFEACEEALANGFRGTTGMMCSWYVTPCDCHFKKDNDIPRVCLSGNETETSLAMIVSEGLTADPKLQSLSAEMAVAIALSAKYPCD